MCSLRDIANMVRAASEFVAGMLAAQRIHSPSALLQDTRRPLSCAMGLARERNHEER
jgi:hypothetical protein